MMIKKTFLLSSTILLLCIQTGYAITSCATSSSTQYQHVFKSLKYAPKAPMASRLQWISQQFLKAPYILNPLGDGEQDPYDQCPLYRLDGFDCETFVTSVLALALSHNQQDYEQCLIKLRYLEGKVAFINRKHFTNLDWNIPHQAQGITQDITKKIKNKQGQPVFQLSHTIIDKGNWLFMMQANRIRIEDQTSITQKLAALKALKRKYPPVQSTLPYLPSSVLLGPGGAALLKQIPQGAIIEVVRPDWDLTKIIGTHLDVSHLGFAFWKNEVLYFRNASSINHRVVDEPLVVYLKRYQNSTTIKGINVQVVVSQVC